MMCNVTIEDVMNLGLKVGKIVEVDDHPNAERLFVLKVDMGGEEIRTLVAGLKAFYNKDELLGKKIVVVTNLKPKKLRGIESQGMLLAASDGQNVKILTVDGDISEGSEVR